MDWVIRTPALFQAKAPLVSKAPFSKTTREQWPDYQGNPRLGFLYQHLCAQLFTETPFYNAVSEEIQLINEGKTVGSLDFLAKNRKLNTMNIGKWQSNFICSTKDVGTAPMPKIVWISNLTICSTTNCRYHNIRFLLNNIHSGLVHHNIY